MRAIDAALFVAVLLFVSHLSGPVDAYLDPGTGSLALQVILGGVVGALTVLKLYWRKIKSLFSREKNEHTDLSV